MVSLYRAEYRCYVCYNYMVEYHHWINSYCFLFFSMTIDRLTKMQYKSLQLLLEQIFTYLVFLSITVGSNYQQTRPAYINVIAVIVGGFSLYSERSGRLCRMDWQVTIAVSSFLTCYWLVTTSCYYPTVGRFRYWHYFKWRLIEQLGGHLWWHRL